MMRHIHLDCFSGVSGNMLLGALLNAGYPEEQLRSTLAGLNLDGFRLEISEKHINGFQAVEVRVHCEKSDRHRHLADIRAILEQADIDTGVAAGALSVFTRLAQAEAAVHGSSVESVHFHEVGAIDAVVDIVGATAGFHYLKASSISCSPLPMPYGWVNCEHGEIPLPAPAVCELLKGVPVYGDQLTQELVTPTGAALVTELASDFGPMPPMILQSTAYGAGTMVRSDNRPNLLRLQIGDRVEVEESLEVDVLDTHIDDWNPEFWPYVSERLMDAGALDVSLIPMQMKKGRPGFLLRLVSTPALTPRLQNIIFQETGTIGIRRRKEQRTVLKREKAVMETPWGTIAAKRIHTPDGMILTPEYESCKEIAKLHKVPLKKVYASAMPTS